MKVVSICPKSEDEGLTIVERLRRYKKAMSPKRLAMEMDCTPRNLQAKAKVGKIPSYRFFGAIKFDPVVIADWLESKRVA